MRPCFALLMIALCSADQAAAFSYVPSPTGSWVLCDYSNDGLVLGLNADGQHYLWTYPAEYEHLGGGRPNATGNHMSGDARYVAGSNLNGLRENVPALWTRGVGWQTIPMPPGAAPIDSVWGSGWAVSSSGVFVGMHTSPAGDATAFTWTPEAGPVALERLAGSTQTRPNDISDDGSVIVGFDNHPDLGHRRPVRWHDGWRHDLFQGKEAVGEATSCSSDGRLIAGTIGYSSFIFDDSTGVTTTVPPMVVYTPGERVRFNCISDDGFVVGAHINLPYKTYDAIIWSEATGLMLMRDWIEANGGSIPEEYFLSSGLAVSADGRRIAIDYFRIDYPERGLIHLTVGAISGVEDQRIVADTPGLKAQITNASPNPFNPMVNIEFAVQESQPVDLGVYDLQGRLVRKLVRETRSTGTHTVRWDGRDESGREVPSSVYLVRLLAEGVNQQRKITLVR